LKLLVERNSSAHEEYLAEIRRKDERKPSYVRISVRFMPCGMKWTVLFSSGFA
jgi:hypothetical protein